MVRIDLAWPSQVSSLTDEQVLELYGPDNASDPWLSVNFVSSVDGAATVDGRSAGLGGDSDRRVFDLLRRHCDAVVVAAGTVRTEEYGPMVLDAESALWRVDHGLPEHPVFVIVSGSANLDPTSRVFTEAPVRPIVVTTEHASASRVDPLKTVADVIVAGRDTVDPRTMREALVARDLRHAHSEGGPSMLGALIEAGVVDEFCLTMSPQLVAGDAGRIASSGRAAPASMRPAHVLVAEDGSLLLRYLRSESAE